MEKCFCTLSNQILDNSCQNPYIFCTCMSYIQHTDDKNDCYFPILVSTKNRMLPLTFNYRASVSMESRFSYTLQQPSDQYLVKEFFNESSTLLHLLKATIYFLNILYLLVPLLLINGALLLSPFLLCYHMSIDFSST